MPVSTLTKLAIGSIFLGLCVLALKVLAWWITGSVALYSDALESTVNIATAIAALIAIRVAAIPADATHPYGHHKAEFFSAVLEGVMIILAALLILQSAWASFLSPVTPKIPMTGVAINILATLLNMLWCRVLLTKGKLLKSPALIADGKHLLADVITSVGVATGIALAWATDIWILDPIMATVVALNILWSGWRVMRGSLSGLLDESVPEATLAQIRKIIATKADGAVEAHDLRTRHAGAATFIDFHLVVEGHITVAAAHEICDRIEAALRAKIPDASITIHVEPEEKAKHNGIVVLNQA